MARTYPALVSLGLVLVALGGCHAPAKNVQTLDAINPPATDFQHALAAEYQDYAQSEAEQGYKTSADYFAGKGLKALHGDTVPPDEINAKLPQAQKDQLHTSRQLLLTLLTDDLEHVAPQKAARAQALFDCWQNQDVRQAGIGGKAPLVKEEALLCDDEFTASITELQEVADTFSQAHEISDTIGFTRKSAVLDDASMRKVKNLAAKVLALPKQQTYSVELDGHADTYRAPDKGLEAERVRAVQAALAQAGIAPEAILVKEGGEKAVVLSSDEDAHEGHNEVNVTVRSKAVPAEKKAAP